MKNSLILALSLMVVSCAHTGFRTEDLFKMDEKKVSNLFTCKENKFDKFDFIIGPWVHDQPGYLVGERYFLRGFIDKKTNRIQQHQIYAETGYQDTDWIFFESCVDLKANQLKCTKIDRTVQNCTGRNCVYKEQMGLDISDNELRSIAKAKNNYLFALKSKNGEVAEFNIDHRYIEAYLREVDKENRCSFKNKE
jgi:hypothetical protein